MHKQPNHSTAFYKCTTIQDLWSEVIRSDYVRVY